VVAAAVAALVGAGIADHYPRMKMNLAVVGLVAEVGVGYIVVADSVVAVYIGVAVGDPNYSPCH